MQALGTPTAASFCVRFRAKFLMDTLSLRDRLEVSDDPTHSVSYLASALREKLSRRGLFMGPLQRVWWPF